MVTLHDIGRRVGVSAKTVSSVINKKRDVGEETRKRVLKAIRELNYIPNEAARRLKTGHVDGMTARKTMNIGIVTFTSLKFSDPYYSKVLDGIDAESVRLGYHVFFLYRAQELIDKQELLVKMINPENIDGIILLRIKETDENVMLIDSVKKRVGALVCVDYSFDESLDFIDVDKFQAGRDATRYLLNLGHRKVGFIGFDDPSDLRRRGYFSALQDAGIDRKAAWEIFVKEERDLENKRQWIENIFARGQDAPTAFFAGSDRMAISAINALRERGTNVPKDLSVIGFDDLDESRSVYPPLTTMKVFKEDIGAGAVKRLVERISKPGLTTARTMIPAKLAIRGSCRQI